MRKIKFRVWDIPNQCWSDLFHAITEDGALWYFPNIGLAERDDAEQYIVERYIGLEDRTGREIYEGDIVEDTLDGLKYEVRWIEYEARLIGVRKRLPNWYPNDTSWVHIEVIGNIHENPELIGGEDEE